MHLLKMKDLILNGAEWLCFTETKLYLLLVFVSSLCQRNSVKQGILLTALSPVLMFLLKRLRILYFRLCKVGLRTRPWPRCLGAVEMCITKSMPSSSIAVLSRELFSLTCRLFALELNGHGLCYLMSKPRLAVFYPPVS